MRTTVTGLVLAGMLLAGGLLAQQKKQPEIDLQAAIRTETVDGDLKAAIKQYGDIVAKYKNDRAVTAMALLHMAECYQKMGDAESHKIYERVVREYADQKEAVATARARLGSAAEKGAGIVARQVWVGPKVSTEGTVSPDGRYVSFPDWSANELGLHDLLTGNDRRLTAKDGSQKSFEYAEESAISRDGKQVAFAWFNGERYDLRVTELTGSPAAKPRILLTNAEVAWIAPYDWSPDGKWIAVQLQRKDRTAQLGLVSVLDGALRVLRSVDWSGSSNLLFSPDGKYLAYDLPASDGSDQRDIFLMATNASKEIPLLVQPADETVLAWTPDGKHLLFASNRGGATGLWAISLNDGKPQDSPLLIKPDIGHASRGLGVTRSGTLYLGVGVGGQDVYIAAVDFQTGKTLSAPAKPIQQFVGANRQPSFSPDGKYMAYQSIRGRSSMVLAIRSLETGQVRELRPDLSYFNQMEWAPDSRSVAVRGRDNKGRDAIFRIDTQTGAVSPLVLKAQGVFRPMWSPDGKILYYRRADRGGGAIISLDIASGAEREILQAKNLAQPRLSPDGRQFILIGGEGRGSLMVVPVDGGTPREILSLPKNESFRQLEWTSDGHSVIASKVGPGGFEAGLALWRIPVSGGSPQRMELNNASMAGEYSVHPDGRRIAFTSGQLKHEIWVIENFLPLLKASR